MKAAENFFASRSWRAVRRPLLDWNGHDEVELRLVRWNMDSTGIC